MFLSELTTSGVFVLKRMDNRAVYCTLPLPKLPMALKPKDIWGMSVAAGDLADGTDWVL